MAKKCLRDNLGEEGELVRNSEVTADRIWACENPKANPKGSGAKIRVNMALFVVLLSVGQLASLL